ncbi:hypothetical protein Patl1_24132 [Pistacia atlantica]|uniref:Uncharacterized protein n=1 Tax=Pistacia atlantica TaxID=434234 RepID=A0ACC1A2I9_9ROSI|nr:hypothetical protein Patl1_24132 [Pistacia atlantica]
MKHYLRLSTACEIWCALSKVFYDESDELLVFSLHQKAFTAKQNGRPLSVYYGELTEIFQKLNHRNINAVPNLKEGYSKVRREAVRQTTLNGESGIIEISAMVAQNRSQHTKSSNKFGHTKNQCFELIGYPDWWDRSHDQRKKYSKKNSKKNSIATILEKKEDADQCLSVVATTRNNGESLHMCTSVSNSAWIIDSSATGHMTFDSMHISHLKPSSHKFMSIANGKSTQVIGE